MAKSQQPLIFVDTNVLLDFYRMREDSGMRLLRRLDSLHSQIITTYQVEMEFKRNRQRVIVEFQKELTECVRTISAPAFLAESKTNRALAKLLTRTKSQVAKLRQRLLSLLENPSKDPVWQVADSLFQNPSRLNLRRDNSERSAIKEKAAMRFRLGYPPRKSGDTSMGDAFNWEWIVHCIQRENRNIVVVSRDADYGVTIGNESFPNDWLVQEVRERTKKTRKIQLVDRLSKALKQIKIEVSPEEIQQETATSALAAANAFAARQVVDSGRYSKGVLGYLEEIDAEANEKAALTEMVLRFATPESGNSPTKNPADLV